MGKLEQMGFNFSGEEKGTLLSEEEKNIIRDEIFRKRKTGESLTEEERKFEMEEREEDRNYGERYR